MTPSQVTSARNSFDESLLETLCEIWWDVKKEDLTDEFLLSKIHAIVESLKNERCPTSKSSFGRSCTSM